MIGAGPRLAPHELAGLRQLVDVLAHNGKTADGLRQLLADATLSAALSVCGQSVAVDHPAGARFITTEAAGRLAGVDARTVRRRAAAGKLPGAHQVGGVWLVPADALTKET